MTGLGHNGGPEMAGVSWRKHCWSLARAELLPHLPLEVLRTRVRRAADLGLDYKTYASVRASSGHDVVAFLFSSNALRMLATKPELPADRAARLLRMAHCGRLALAVTPLRAEVVLAAGQGLLHAAHAAPDLLGGFGQMKARMAEAIVGQPRDGVVLVGDMALEREWCAAGRLAYYLPAERVFTP